MKRYLLFVLEDEYYYGGLQDFKEDFENELSAINKGLSGMNNGYWREFQVFDSEKRVNNVYSINQKKIINWSEKI